MKVRIPQRILFGIALLAFAFLGGGWLRQQLAMLPAADAYPGARLTSLEEYSPKQSHAMALTPGENASPISMDLMQLFYSVYK
ncbi:MAG: hypothetical protein RMM06_11840, partial [Armatimonadota bacterium]|nr:hypothetical protein [Armatimonadota bacterium]